MINFPTGKSDWDLRSPALFDLFFSFSAPSICYIMTFSSLGNSDDIVSVSTDFTSDSKRDASFDTAYDVWTDQEDLHNHLRDVPCQDNFKLLLLLLAYVTGSRLELMFLSLIINIRGNIIQLQPTQQCSAAIAHKKIISFVGTDRINLLLLKWSPGRLAFVAKGFLKLPNLSLLLKQKESITFQKVAPLTIGKLIKIFSIKLNLLYLIYLMALKYRLLQVIRQNCLLITFLRTLILMIQVPLYLLSLLKVIWDIMFL